MERKKLSVPDFLKMKQEGRKIIKVNLYDYPTAYLADQAGVDMVMIGDSVGNVVLGYEKTLPVTMEEMIHHAKAVVRGAKHCFVICDMPFMSYEVNVEDALRNAGRIMKETGVDAIKLEGGFDVKEKVAAIVRAGIPVMGHIGLLPQRVSHVGRYRVQGRDAENARLIIRDAEALEEAGAFCVVLESVAAEVTKLVTERLKVPTIGAGSGPYCDGQSLNLYDLIGLSIGIVPKFAKRYLHLSEDVIRVLEEFRKDAEEGRFPAEEHFFRMADQEYNHLTKNFDDSRR